MKNTKSLSLLCAVLILVITMGAATAQAAQAQKQRFVGTVSTIDLQGENFTITDRNKNITKFFVNPATEFEIEKGKSFFGDDDIPFKDLKVGDWVEVKSVSTGGELEAIDVEIYR